MAAVKVNEDIKEPENNVSAGHKQERCDVVLNCEEQFAGLIYKSTYLIPKRTPAKKANLPPEYRIWYVCSPESDLNADIKDGNIVPVDTHQRITEELLERTAVITGLGQIYAGPIASPPTGRL